jgi:hypothetical protein
MVKAGMQGVVANGESLIFQARKVIADLALARNLPSCGYVRELLEAGGLISYGVDQRAMDDALTITAFRDFAPVHMATFYEVNFMP